MEEKGDENTLEEGKEEIQGDWKGEMREDGR